MSAGEIVRARNTINRCCVICGKPVDVAQRHVEIVEASWTEALLHADCVLWKIEHPPAIAVLDPEHVELRRQIAGEP